MSSLTLLLALLLDKCFSEPKCFHPLVGFGTWADVLERRFNQSNTKYLAGVFALSLAVTPIVLLAVLLEMISNIHLIVDCLLSAFVLYVAIGWQSLMCHAKAIKLPLMANDLESARRALAMIVSRDTSELTEKDIAKAATESVLENGADAIFSAIFWFVVAGIPGVVLYRLSNTLDAMWGYKNKRFLYFGWAAARLDDVLNFIPARLTALSYALMGDFSKAIYYWKNQGFNWKSPNAGPVMASGAGAINTSLGGSAIYHGEPQQRPTLGPEENIYTAANFSSIQQACDLVNKSLLLWTVLLLLAGILL